MMAIHQGNITTANRFAPLWTSERVFWLLFIILLIVSIVFSIDSKSSQQSVSAIVDKKTRGVVFIDSPYQDSFGHWVFESAIFLPEIRNSGMKAGVSAKKQYKFLFCKHFGLTADDIVYTNNLSNSSTTMMSNPVPPEYPALFRSFFLYFVSTVLPDVEFVLLPRQKKENYAHNDRPCVLTPHLHVFENSRQSYRIVDTDDVTDLRTQIDLVNSGKTVILTDGSPALVNGMFCSGKTIYIVRSGLLETQMLQHPMLKFVYNEIQIKNKVQFIDGDQLFTLLQ